MTAAGQNEKVCVGMITTVHGVRGNVKVKSFTACASDFAAYGDLQDASGKRSFAMKIVGELKDQFLVKIDGVNDRTTAEGLRGIELYVNRSQLPETAEDEFYYTDLIGMSAETPSGEKIGSVIGVYNFGAGDMLEIEKTNSQTEFVSFTKQIVPVIDLKKRTLTVCLPETVEVKPETERSDSGMENRKHSKEPKCKE